MATVRRDRWHKNDMSPSNTSMFGNLMCTQPLPHSRKWTILPMETSFCTSAIILTPCGYLLWSYVHTTCCLSLVNTISMHTGNTAGNTTSVQPPTMQKDKLHSLTRHRSWQSKAHYFLQNTASPSMHVQSQQMQHNYVYPHNALRCGHLPSPRPTTSVAIKMGDFPSLNSTWYRIYMEQPPTYAHNTTYTYITDWHIYCHGIKVPETFCSH